MKACPGLRSGIDRSSSLSLVIPSPQFVIPAIKSMPRTPIRGRNPEGWGEGNVAPALAPNQAQCRHGASSDRPASNRRRASPGRFREIAQGRGNGKDLTRHPPRHCRHPLCLSGEGRNPGEARAPALVPSQAQCRHGASSDRPASNRRPAYL